MLRGTDLGLQISAGHHLQSRRKKKNISSLNHSFPISLMGLRNKSQFSFPKEMSSFLMQPRFPLAMLGKLHAKHKQSSYSKLRKSLLRISVAWEWVSRITCKHLYCCSWLKQTPARTAGLCQPLLSHILITLCRAKVCVQSRVHPCLGKAFQGPQGLTPSRGITVFLTLDHDDSAALSSCNSRVRKNIQSIKTPKRWTCL